MIGQTISHYKILEKLGEGGMGVVYKAEDTKLQRTVALKFLSHNLLESDKDKSRFVREAQAAAGLDHTNICTVHEIDEADGHTFIVMAYVEGESLRERLEHGAPLEIERAVDIATQIARGLARAHKKGIVHRDVKPANIRITPENEVKIVDFGLAKAASQTRLTQTGMTVGTVAYMSPEQAQGGAVDHRSDIFSLGVVLYEMLAGRLPFRGDHNAAILYGIVNAEPEPLESVRDDLPAGLVQIVAKALAKKADERYQSAADVVDDLGRLVRGDTPRLRTRRKRRLKFAIPAVVVVLAAVVAAVKFGGFGGSGAVAAENKLVVFDFENVADPGDPGRTGEIVSNYLIAGLSESEHVSVVSNERRYDLLNRLGKADLKITDGATATEVATEAGAKWIVRGSILQSEPYYVVTSRVVNVDNGDVAASQRATGVPGELIFSLVDRLTREIKSDLGIPAGAEEDRLASVADVTTQSEDAYRHYVEGMDYLNRGFGPEAKASFERALRYDSTFAMVYLRLATSPYISSDQMEKKAALEKAVRYADRAGKKDQLYITSAQASSTGDLSGAVKALETLVEMYPEEKEAHLQLGRLYAARGDADKATASFERATELDPLNPVTYNTLYAYYLRIGDVDKAIGAINKSIELAPDVHDTYDSRAWGYGYAGRLDEAIQSFDEALERNPDYFTSLAGAAVMHMFKRDYDRARELCRKLMESSEKWERGAGGLLMAYIPLYQGKLEEGLKVLDVGISADEMAGYAGDHYANKICLRSHIHFERSDRERAVADAHRFLDVCEKGALGDYLSFDMVYICAQAGEYARAEEILTAQASSIDSTSRVDMADYRLARGCVEKERGNLDAAHENLQMAADDKRTGTGSWITRYLLAMTLLDAGRPQDAIREFEKALRIYEVSRAMYPMDAVKEYYYLALAYEQTGQAGKAARQYETFLDIWQNADPGIEEVEDAKRRLARLREET
jgi:tetratricopeptide (TPR) repeat protein/tRNA A-37 threonylcarbamoyl transferase component Bud32